MGNRPTCTFSGVARQSANRDMRFYVHFLSRILVAAELHDDGRQATQTSTALLCLCSVLKRYVSWCHQLQRLRFLFYRLRPDLDI
jgi:hypothetical protein